MDERVQYLFQQYEKNNCSREELEELFLYIRTMRSNDVTLKKLMQQLYDDIRRNHPSFTYVDENGKLILTQPDDVNSSSGMQGVRKTVRRNTRIFFVAGIMTATVIWLFNHDFSKKAPEKKSTVSAGVMTKKFSERGEQKYLLLPDSTEVWLNAASSIEFPDHFNADKREVKLQGEAFFKISRDAKKPFIIRAGKVSALTQGSSFNIKAYPGERSVTVSVSEGKVKLNRDEAMVATYMRGQQVKIDNETQTIAEGYITAGKVAAWRQDDIIYEDEYLGDVIADLERVYNVNISVESSDILYQKISASFKKIIGIKQALATLCQLSDTEFSDDGHQFTIR